MGSGRLSQFPFAGAVLVAAVLAPARDGEPSARELVALAPVLDSSDGGCRSLDIGGYLGGDEGPGPRMRFRALYRAPDQFSLLVSDAADGTPLVHCSGKKMLVYDPIGPTVYYSEDAGFILEACCANSEFKLNCTYLLKSRSPHRVLVDLRSVLPGLSGEERAAGAGAFEDRVVRRKDGKFELIRKFNDKMYLSLSVDLTKECPYTAAAFVWDGTTILSLDRLTLNGVKGDEPFAFPAKERLPRGLLVKDVTTDEDVAMSLNTAALVGRASVVRSVVNKAGPPGLLNIPGLSGVDWDRVKENDKKFAKALRDLVPPSLRAR